MSNNLAENLFIVTAPSGAGKTTLIKNIIEFAKTNNEKVFMSVSHTTRTPRANESDGTDYFFISKEEFKLNIDKGVYLEHALVHENLYGTPKKAINDHLQRGYKVLLEIDWQGAVEILKTYPDAQSIFISPPSIEELHKRLHERGLDSEEVIAKRVEGAKLEMEKSSKFKYQIINNSLETALKNLLNIIFREKHG
jgi:guanylate kinase